jgi:Sap-like sulfolipid-1-addressing protein
VSPRPGCSRGAIFVLIEFSLVIIPFAFLEFRPEATKARLLSAQDWLMSHARQLMAAVALFVGAYMVISGLGRLLPLPDRHRAGTCLRVVLHVRSLPLGCRCDWGAGQLE